MCERLAGAFPSLGEDSFKVTANECNQPRAPRGARHAVLVKPRQTTIVVAVRRVIIEARNAMLACWVAYVRLDIPWVSAVDDTQRSVLLFGFATVVAYGVRAGLTDGRVNAEPRGEGLVGSRTTSPNRVPSGSNG